MRWKNFGETTTEEGHKVFLSGREDKHEHGIGFLIHKEIVNTVMGCCPVSGRLITIRLRAVRFNITIVQAYALTSDYVDNKIEEFYDQLQCVSVSVLFVQGLSLTQYVLARMILSTCCKWHLFVHMLRRVPAGASARARVLA